MLQAKVKEFGFEDAKDSIGIKDGGHVYLHCSMCGKGLISIFITQPKAIDPLTNKVFEWKVKAKCCYCGDFSYIKEIKGKFHLAGFGEIKEDDQTQDIPETFPDGDYEEGDVLVFKTVKANG